MLNGLAERIQNYEYHPEVYTYPTPRMYGPLPEGFSPFGRDLTNELNVYVHVPFCRQICTFCGYFKLLHEEGLESRFVAAVEREIELRAEALTGRVVRTLHFGGGTPSLLSPEQLRRLIAALRGVNPRLLDTCLEVSIEATPESVERQKFAGYRAAGLNRVSLGVQSLVDHEVALANRCLSPGRSAYELLAEAVESLREVGITDVVIDLMIGIEGQSEASFAETLSRAVILRPQTIQLYALGVMPKTGLARKDPSRRMDGPQIYRCYEESRRQLQSAGYRRETHDRYTLHEHNGFIQGDDNIRGVSLLGLGAGARSYARDAHYRNTYAQLNSRRALEQYMQNLAEGRHSVESGVLLDADERMRQYAIGHLTALDTGQFQERFGVRFEERFGPLYEEMLRLELAEPNGPILQLTPRGLLFRDLLARQLFSERARRLEDAYRS